MWRDVQRARRDAFSGKLYIQYTERFDADALDIFCMMSLYRWVQSLVSELHFTGLHPSVVYHHYRQEIVWRDIFAKFPVVKKIELDCFDEIFISERCSEFRLLVPFRGCRLHVGSPRQKFRHC